MRFSNASLHAVPIIIMYIHKRRGIYLCIYTSLGNIRVFARFYRFQKALKAYGVADLDVFQTVDLYECKDFAQVITTLFSLGREVRTIELYNINHTLTAIIS